jgi:ribosomal protein L13
VIVVNADKVRVSGRSDGQDLLRHTGYPGGIKGVTFERMQAQHPERVIETAVRGMLPHNPLGRDVRKLKVYAGPVTLTLLNSRRRWKSNSWQSNKTTERVDGKHRPPACS